MAKISTFGPVRHLRAGPNEFILHYKGGKLVRTGAGLAYFFNPLAASIAQLPVEDCEITFVLNERASDFQEVTIQTTLTYRIVDHARAAARVNFGIALETGAWMERPLERLGSLWAQKALDPVRRFVSASPIVEVVQRGAEQVGAALDSALRGDAELAAIGVTLVTAQVVRVAPTAELEKAMQTPTREALQQKADEAVFARRALAVEKERAIKENELATELELARRQTQLIDQRGANALREVEQAAKNARAKTEADLALAALAVQAAAQKLLAEAEAESARRQTLARADSETAAIAAAAHARDVATRSAADADAQRRMTLVTLENEQRRVELWKQTPSRIASAFAMQTAASKLEKVNHLNVTPDLLRTLVQELATGDAGADEAAGASKKS